MFCPNKNNKLYKQLEDRFGKENAYEVWYQLQTPSFEKWYGKGNLDVESNPVLTDEYTFVNESGESVDITTLFSKRSMQERTISKIEELSTGITKDDKGYIKDGKRIKNRVTDISKAGGKARNKELTAEQIAEFERAAEDGTKIHGFIENIVNVIYGKATKPTLEGVDEIMYNKLENYFKPKIEEAKSAGSKILMEQIIYDESRDLAGTVDMIIVDKEGKISIYDFKTFEEKQFKNSDGKMVTIDRSFFKVEEYDIQVNEYKKILKKKGFKNRDFSKLRIIPIAREYKTIEKDGKWVKTFMRNIEIGKKVKLIEDGKEVTIERDNLDMIPVANELSTTDSDNELIGRIKIEIGKLKTKYKNTVDKEQRQAIASKIVAQQRAIKNILLRQDYNSVLDAAELEIDDINNRMLLMTGNELLESTQLMNLYTNFQKYLPSIDELDKTESGKALKNKMFVVQGMARNVETKLEKRSKEYLSNQARGIGVKDKDIFKPQKELGFMAKYFNSISQMNHPIFKVFYNLVKKQKDKVNQESLELSERISNAVNKLKEWGTLNGVSGFNLYDKLVKEKKREDGSTGLDMIDKYSSAYYQARKNGKLDGATINKKAYDEAFAEYKDKVMSTEYELTKEKNDAKRQELLSKWIKINSNPATVYTSMVDRLVVFEDDRWLSNEYKEISRPGNEALLEFYNLFKDTIKEYKNFLPQHIGSNFIPNVTKTLVEQGLRIGDVTGMRDNLLESFEVKQDDEYYGAIDETTGEKLYKIPVLFTKDMDASTKSKNLGTSLMLFAQSALNYKYMSEIEGDALLLANELSNQNQIITNQFGSPILDKFTGEVKIAEGNSNSKEAFRDFLNYYIYGIKMKSSDTVIERNGKTYSGTKMVKGAMRFFSIKSLSLNTISGIANTIGGLSNAYAQGARNRYYTGNHMNKSMWLIAKNDKKAKALVNKFDTKLDKKKWKLARNLSVSTLDKTLTSDKFYIVQELGDNAVQNGVLLSMLQAYGVKDGRIDKLEKTGGKSLYELADENGNVAIPLDEKLRFEDMVESVTKNIIGNMSDEDISTIRLSLLGNILMMFRNWIPRTAQERFAGLRYNQDIEGYELGRYRYFSDAIVAGKLLPVLKDTVLQLLMIRNANKSTGTIKELYKKAKARAEQLGEEFTISEDEYVELVLGNIRANIREAQIILSTYGAFIALDYDDDDERNAIRTYALKAIDRAYSELAFYSNPVEFVKIVKSPVPMVGILTDTVNLVESLVREPFTDDKANQPTKYILRNIPMINGINRAYEIVTSANKELD